MKSSIVIASCFLGYAAAGPQGSVKQDAHWTLRNVTAASTVAGSTLLTSYSLIIQASNQTANCNATTSATGSLLGKLDETKCSPGTFAFSWTPLGNAGADGYTIEVFDDTIKQHATHHVAADEIKNRPFVIHDAHPHYYAGPAEFQVQTEDGR